MLLPQIHPRTSALRSLILQSCFFKAPDQSLKLLAPAKKLAYILSSGHFSLLTKLMTRYTAQSSVQFSKAAPEWRSHVGAVHFLWFIDVFIFSCAESSFLCGLFSYWGKWGLLSSCHVWASHCSGFSRCGAQAPGCVGFCSCDSQALEHKFNSCGAWACGIFLDRGSNLCLLHWRVDSLRLSHHGSQEQCIFKSYQYTEPTHPGIWLGFSPSAGL